MPTTEAEMDIASYLTNDEQLVVGSARDCEPARLILQAIEKRLEEIRRSNEMYPVRDDRDLRNDYVYKIGQIAELNWILALCKDARRIATGGINP